MQSWVQALGDIAGALAICLPPDSEAGELLAQAGQFIGYWCVWPFGHESCLSGVGWQGGGRTGRCRDGLVGAVDAGRSSWAWMSWVSSPGWCEHRNGTHPAARSAAVSGSVRAAHQRPVSLSQTRQRPPNTASMAAAAGSLFAWAFIPLP